MSILRIRDAQGKVVNIPAIKGDSYVLTETDKASIAATVKEGLKTESWTFELEDGTTVTKAVLLG